MLKNSVGALIFLTLVILFFITASIGVSSAPIEAFLVLGLLGSTLVFIILAIIAAIWTHYEYKNYTFILDEHALEVSRGIFTKENISIPYHHIEDINIDQSVFYQIMGVCRLAILTAGHGEEADRSEGILPAVDLNMGREIQKVIMSRSNVQEVMDHVPAENTSPNVTASSGQN